MFPEVLFSDVVKGKWARLSVLCERMSSEAGSALNSLVSAISVPKLQSHYKRGHCGIQIESESPTRASLADRGQGEGEEGGMRGRRRKSHTEEDILITPCDPNSNQLAGVREMNGEKTA